MSTVAIMTLSVLGGQSLAGAIGEPAAVMGAVGLLLGLGLAVAAKKLAVPKDPLTEKIEDVLPGANCGGCGYPGCPAFAEAVAQGEAPADGCVAASSTVNAKIAEIVGAEVSESVRRVARVKCHGGHSAADAFEYRGPEECASAMLVMGGHKACAQGCLGFGDCVASCPFDAIHMGEGGVPEVDAEKCTACGKCVEACPKDLIVLWPENRAVCVECSNTAKGGVARKQCSVACIGCRKCAKVCPVDAITMDGFLASIDPDKCINCGLCARECPTGAIVDTAPARPRAYIDSNCIGCTICAKVCPVDAIEGEPKERHRVDDEKCIGCGQCVPKCPKNAIRLVGALSYQKEGCED